MNLAKIKLKDKTIHETLEPQMREDFYHFEGNAQALRLVTKLHYLIDQYGMNLTFGLLNTIIKYPISSLEINKSTGNIKDKKMGYNYAEREVFQAIQEETGTNGCRHPLTYILEAADDIAYKTADIEDAFVKGFISYHTIREVLKNIHTDKNDKTDLLNILDSQYERGMKMGLSNLEEYAVKNWVIRVQGFMINCATFGFTSNYNEIMSGGFKRDLFEGTYGQKCMDLLGELAYNKVFTSKEIYKLEVKESVIINHLMNLFVPLMIKYDTGVELDSVDVRLITFVSKNYISAYHYHAKGKSDVEKLYLRLMLVADYICGMTDSYIVRLYQEIQGVSSMC